LNKTDTLETLVKEILDSFKFTKSKERKQKWNKGKKNEWYNKFL
jgi:hypothetical protein